MNSLIASGQMHSSGLDIFNKRNEAKSNQYSYENKPEYLASEFETIFKNEPDAWNYFDNQSKSYKKTIFYWVMSAKKDITKRSRLEKVINQSKLFKKLQ